MNIGRQRTSFCLLVLYLLALLQSPAADTASSFSADCRPHACGDSSIGLHSGVSALSPGGQYRLFGDPTRSPGNLLDQGRFSADAVQARSDNASALRASCLTSTLEHRAIRQLIRAAGTGFRSCAPRSPPRLL